MNPIEMLQWLESIFEKAGIEIVDTGVAIHLNAAPEASLTIRVNEELFEIEMRPEATEPKAAAA